MTKPHNKPHPPASTGRPPETELEERNRVLQALNDLASRLLRIDTTAEVYEVAIDGILAIVGTRRGAIAIADDAHREFRLATFRGYNEESQRATDHLSYDIPTAHGTARDSRDIIVIHPDQPFQVAQQVLRGEEVQTAVLIPIFDGSSVQGVLSYLLTERRECTPLELEILRTASTYVSAALERARLYETVEAERARLAHILEQLPVGVFIAEGNGEERSARITLTNELGHTQTRASTSGPGTEREVTDYLHPDGTPCPEEERPLQRALWRGVSLRDEELVFRYKNGEERTFLINVSVLGETNGQREVVAVRQDITERRRLEDQVRKQAEEVRTQYERLAALVDNVDVAFTLLDTEKRIILANDAAVQRSGLPREQVIGHSYEELNMINGDNLLVGPRDQVFSTGQPVSIHDLHLVNKGHPEGIYIDWSVLPLRDTEGRITGLITVSIDTTEKVAAREQIEKQRALLETIIDSAPIGLVLYDRDLRIARLNAEFSRLAGSTAEGASEKSPYSFVPEAQDRSALHNRLLAGEPIELNSVPFTNPQTGKLHYLDVRYRPVLDAAGAVTWLLCAVVDVTEREEINKQKDEFIALASHELKTPVTAIKGYAQMGLLTAERAADDRLVRTLRVIDTQADRLTRLINELLDVALVEERHTNPTLEDFDLSKLVQEVAGNLQLTAPNFQVEAALPEEPVPVHADRHRIEQVLTNLIHNAIKYSGLSRRVNVTLKTNESEAIVAVRDYGVGIPEDQQGRVFERFFRASNVSSSNYGGLGLGLYITRDIVNRHGGRTWLESSVNEGSTFYFSLPLAGEAG